MFSRQPIYCTEDAKRRAKRRLPRLPYDYIAGATGREDSTRFNTDAIRAIRLQPRVLQPVQERHLTTELFGQRWARPFGVAPMGMCNLVHPEADRLLHEAGTRHAMPVCTSTAASTSLETVAAMSGGTAWFQLYVTGSTGDALDLVARAAAAGFTTLVVTVDVPQSSRRVRDQRNGLQLPFKLTPSLALDFALHPAWSIPMLRHSTPRPANFSDDKPFNRGASRGNCDIAFLDELRKCWTGSLVVKGIMHSADAHRVRDAGADAIWVSNHGGRQLDAAPPAISVLPSIRAALGEDCPIVFDSGLQNGEDIVKALALGADFCMLGRPWLYALGAGGEAVLNQLIAMLSDDIDVVMAQIGASRIPDIGRHHVAEHNLTEAWV